MIGVGAGISVGLGHSCSIAQNECPERCSRKIILFYSRLLEHAGLSRSSHSGMPFSFYPAHSGPSHNLEAQSPTISYLSINALLPINMKLFLSTDAVLLALCVAESQGTTGSTSADWITQRTRHHGGRPGRLQSMKDDKCPEFLTTFSCPESAANMDCTLERPERPDVVELEFDDEVKAEFQAKKKEFKEQLMKCVCCDVVSVEDILASKGDSGPGPSDPEGGPREGMTGEPGSGSGRPNGIFSEGVSSGSGRPGGMGSGRPGGGGRPDGKDIQAMLVEKCQQFDCNSMAGQEISCDRFDSMSAAGNTRGGRKGTLLYCGCGCNDSD